MKKRVLLVFLFIILCISSVSALWEYNGKTYVVKEGNGPTEGVAYNVGKGTMTVLTTGKYDKLKNSVTVGKGEFIEIKGNKYNLDTEKEAKFVFDEKGELKDGTNFITKKDKFILKGYEYNLPEKTSVLFKDGKVKITLPDGTAVEEPKIVDKESSKNAVFEINAEKGSLIFGKNKDSFDGTLTYETDKDGKLHSYAVDEKCSFGGLEINQKKGEKTELFSDGEMHPEAKEAYLSLGDKTLVIGKNSEGKGPEIKFNEGNRILDKITEEQHVIMSAGRDSNDKEKAEAGTIKITNRGDIVPEVATDKSFRIENGERTIRKGVDKEGSEAILVGSNDNTKGKKSYGMDITNSILQIEDQKYKYAVDGNNQIKLAKIEEAPNKLETNIKEEQEKNEKEKEVKPDAVPEDKPPVSINLGEEGKDPMASSGAKQAADNIPSNQGNNPSLSLKDQLASTTNEAINKYRGSSLVWDQNLANDAYEWSKHMAETNSLYHGSGNFGENILYTYGSLIGSGSPETIGNYFMTRWVNSPGHRANIVNSGYRSTGIGVYVQQLPNGDKKYWATQRFR